MKKWKGVLKRIILATFVFLILFTALVLCIEIKRIPIPKPWALNEEFHLQNSSLGRYFIDLSERKYLIGTIPLDRNGVPLHRGCYHPVYISQYALGAFDYYLNTGNKEAKQAFLTCAAWLRDNLVKRNGFFYWEYTFEIDYPGGLYKNPWYSAMAQGEGVSVLLRAFCETRQREYLSAAKKAIEPIFHDLSEGGISVVKQDGYVFPQEYPTTPISSDILNGAIFAYIGVYEYHKVTKEPKTKQFCDRIAKTFLSVVDEYDAGYWSLYSRWPRKHLASPSYNSLHIAQLRALYLITGEEKFLEYSKKFESYQSNWTDKAKYVFLTNWRQTKEFGLKDVRKIPTFLKKILF
ncbi:MAG: D-glucuronyl C5-epimerase family protein [Phycisphaerae bacterium]|nr:D-glucuronyl C5-epimerase family protein [Phycisphaerae bacterium]MDD5380272.1 D-glucuronyl C5-epimerase family protein [Phycisphaerae bacterium]